MILDDNAISNFPSGRILGMDYGAKRLGCAISDPTQLIASPLETIPFLGPKQVKKKLEEIREQHDIRAFVVGMPFHLHGDRGEAALKVTDFIEILQRRFALPIYEWDERWSTVSAHKVLQSSGKSPSRNRDKVDQVAAAVILQNFLDRLAFARQSL